MYDPTLHIVLFQPEIPYNAGSVGRTCVCRGSQIVVGPAAGFQLNDRYLRRAGLDYWKHLAWEVVDDWNALVERLPRRPFWYFSKTSDTAYTDAAFEKDDVLVFGSESQGLPRSLLEANTDRCLRIPIRADIRSLNLSVSVAVIAFEARRQWEIDENSLER